MFNCSGPGKIGQVYRISSRVLEQELMGEHDLRLLVRDDKQEGLFRFLDSYLYVFHTQVAFLCLGIQYDSLQTLYQICNPGYAELASDFLLQHKTGGWDSFSIENQLESFAAKCGMHKFFDGVSSSIAESYIYTLALVPERLPSIDVMRQATFNLHLMSPLNEPAEDDSEEDLRYVYAVKAQEQRSYRWGCCVSSQTISYIVADETMKLESEMEVQGRDGLPVVLLALYEKFTCLRFTELLSHSVKKDAKYLASLKEMMLKFQAYGTVTPSNLSRWYNVKQIYSALLDVNETVLAVNDIDTKLRILSEQQQDINQRKINTVSGIITVFGIVSIVDSMLSIVHDLGGGFSTDWITAGGTLLSLVVVIAVMLRLLKR